MRMFLILFVCLSFMACSNKDKSSSQANDQEPLPTNLFITDNNVLLAENNQYSGEITINLTYKPSSSVFVELISDNTLVSFTNVGGGTESLKTVEFTPDNYNIPQQIKIYGQPLSETICYGEKFNIDYKVTSSDSTYNGYHIAPLSGVNLAGQASINIQQDRYGISPLTADIKIRTNANAKIGYEIMRKDNASIVDVRKLYSDSLKEQEIILVGLYENHSNTVRLFGKKEDGSECFSEELTLTTDKLPLPPAFDNVSMQVEKADFTKLEPGWTLMQLVDSSYNFIFDLEGNIRWALNDTSGAYPIRLIDGRFEQLISGNNERAIRYFNFSGLEYKDQEVNLENHYVHHDFCTKPDGKLLILVDKKGHQYIEDHIIEYEPQTGAVIKEWDLAKVLPTDRTDFINWPEGYKTDWLHMNSIAYDATDDTIVFSGRHQGVFKITYPDDQGAFEVKWALSPHKGFEGVTPDISNKLLKPLDSHGNPITDNDVINGITNSPDFEWNWAQHSAMILDNGNILLYDNGDNRNFGTAPNYSRIVEYEIDEDNMTVKQVWDYGKERGETLYSMVMSNVAYLKNGNYYMSSAMTNANSNPQVRIVEVDKNKNVVYEAYSTKGFVYRSYRVPLFDYMYTPANIGM